MFSTVCLFFNYIRYGGFQFGYWAEQLGDGRAILLGEYINSRKVFKYHFIFFSSRLIVWKRTFFNCLYEVSVGILKNNKDMINQDLYFIDDLLYDINLKLSKLIRGERLELQLKVGNVYVFKRNHKKVLIIKCCTLARINVKLLNTIF